MLHIVYSTAIHPHRREYQSTNLKDGKKKKKEERGTVVGLRDVMRESQDLIQKKKTHHWHKSFFLHRFCTRNVFWDPGSVCVWFLCEGRAEDVTLTKISQPFWLENSSFVLFFSRKSWILAPVLFFFRNGMFQLHVKGTGDDGAAGVERTGRKETTALGKERLGWRIYDIDVCVMARLSAPEEGTCFVEKWKKSRGIGEIGTVVPFWKRGE